MTDLPRDLRQRLAQEFTPLATHIVRHQRAGDGTQKLLLRLSDDQVIECVLIPENERRTACISTQVGCGMGCVFCASGLNGVVRNLTAGEILEQLLRLRNLLPLEERLTNIVVMGMGEPLANLDALLEALVTATSKAGLGIGARHVTISTVGLPAKIRRLADLGKPYHLAVSLHAPNDQLRTRIVPTNDKTGLKAILAAADYYFEKTGRQLTYEYVLLRGLNGVVRNLTAGEILEQLVLLRNLTAEPNGPPQYGLTGQLATRLTHVVVMGMGEPLANLDALLEALAVATARDGLALSARHVTISTVGLPAKIRRLADMGLPPGRLTARPQR